MRFILILFLFLSVQSFALAAIYQSVDAEGNVVFSDKPTKGSIERKIKEPPVIKMQTKPQIEESEKVLSPQTEDQTESQVAKEYQSFSIVSPQDDEGVRENDGNVSVKLKLQPELQKKFGHYIMLSLDNKLLSEKYTSSSMVLKNLDRGTHQLSASVYNKRGDFLKKTPDISFHLLRFSILFRKN